MLAEDGSGDKRPSAGRGDPNHPSSQTPGMRGEQPQAASNAERLAVRDSESARRRDRCRDGDEGRRFEERSEGCRGLGARPAQGTPGKAGFQSAKALHHASGVVSNTPCHRPGCDASQGTPQSTLPIARNTNSGGAGVQQIAPRRVLAGASRRYETDGGAVLRGVRLAHRRTNATSGAGKQDRADRQAPAWAAGAPAFTRSGGASPSRGEGARAQPG